jgi:hypothetical protein
MPESCDKVALGGYVGGVRSCGPCLPAARPGRRRPARDRAAPTDAGGHGLGACSAALEWTPWQSGQADLGVRSPDVVAGRTKDPHALMQAPIDLQARNPRDQSRTRDNRRSLVTGTPATGVSGRGSRKRRFRTWWTADDIHAIIAGVARDRDGTSAGGHTARLSISSGRIPEGAPGGTGRVDRASALHAPRHFDGGRSGPRILDG